MATICEFQGDPDLFGLGVRIGSYLQWLALILASVRFPEKTANTVNAISLFQLAFLIAFVWATTVTPDAIYNIEAFIITAFGAGGGLVLSVVHSSNHVSHLARAFVSLLALGFAAAALWLWSSGLYTLPQASCSWVFIFSKVRMDGGVRYFGIVSASLATVGSLISLTRIILGLSYNWKNRNIWLLGLPQPGNHGHTPKPSAARLLAPVAQLLALISLILTVEETIAWNNVTGVNNVRQTGQLIPLVVGSGILLQVVIPTTEVPNQ